MTTSTPEVSTWSTSYFLVLTQCPVESKYVNWQDKWKCQQNITIYIREEKSIPSSCSFSTALLTRGVISVELEVFFSMLSQLWNWKQKLAEIAQMTIILTTQLRQRYSPYQPWQSKRTGHEDSDAIYRGTVRRDNLRIEPFNFFIQF